MNNVILVIIMCKCNKRNHVVYNITSNATNLILSVSNSTNIGDNERFIFYFPNCRRQTIRSVITGAPLPVLVNVNGVDVQLIYSNCQAVLSNRVPRRADGRYIVPETGEPFIQLFYPECVRF